MKGKGKGGRGKEERAGRGEGRKRGREGAGRGEEEGEGKGGRMGQHGCCLPACNLFPPKNASYLACFAGSCTNGLISREGERERERERGSPTYMYTRASNDRG